jgi:Xaa-Pro aminopeptidase
MTMTERGELIAGVPARELLEAKAPGLGLADTEPTSFDPRRLRAERLARLREMMRRRDYAAVLLFDPNNQRYATGSRNMFGYFLRNSTRYFFVPVEGPIVLFEYPQSAHVSEVLETVDEVRDSKVVWSSVRGADDDTAGPFAREIAELVGGSKHGKVGLDRCSHVLALALQRVGLTVADCNQDILHARRIKTADEVTCLRLSLAASEAALFDLQEKIRPGVSELELFAAMYGSVIAGGGEMIETRLVNSGPRTNPWFNEASARRVRPGELVAVDTDTIGCCGYYSDFSRTFHCGPGRPTGEHKALYSMAYDQIQHNIEILRPGMSYREVAEAAWTIPERFVDRRYTSVMHGCGMHGETPFIPHLMDFDRYGSDGYVEAGMVLCVESYVGEVGGRQGVKLEEEVLVTPDGVELLSQYPFDERLLGDRA